MSFQLSAFRLLLEKGIFLMLVFGVVAISERMAGDAADTRVIAIGCVGLRLHCNKQQNPIC